MIDDLRFPVADLLNQDVETSSKPIKFEVPAGKYDDIVLPNSLVGNVIFLAVDEGSVRVYITATGSVAVTCDRCLKPFHLPIKLMIDEVVTPESAELDLKPWLFQEIQLQIPMKLLCHKNCPGIPICSN